MDRTPRDPRLQPKAQAGPINPEPLSGYESIRKSWRDKAMSDTGRKEQNDEWFTTFLFAVKGVEAESGVFVAKTNDRTVVKKAREQLLLPKEKRNLHINGKLEAADRGSNMNWSWQFQPNTWDLVEISAADCDGTPQMVEDKLDYWLREVTSFCPWRSIVLLEMSLP
jgi:hypothetical protein